MDIVMNCDMFVTKKGKVDFVILKEGQVVDLIEAKYADAAVSKSLAYYAAKLNPLRASQIVAQLKRPYQQGAIKVIHPVEALQSLEE